jgi:hypothetical protein
LRRPPSPNGMTGAITRPRETSSALAAAGEITKAWLTDQDANLSDQIDTAIEKDAHNILSAMACLTSTGIDLHTEATGQDVRAVLRAASAQALGRGPGLRPSDCDRMLKVPNRSKHAAASARYLATFLATQALLPDPTGRHWMKSVPHLSSHDDAPRDQLEGFGPTRNRKVEGSNPSSGSKTAGQRVFLRVRTVRWRRAVIPWVDQRAAGAPTPLRYVGVRLAD